MKTLATVLIEIENIKDNIAACEATLKQLCIAAGELDSEERRNDMLSLYEDKKRIRDEWIVRLKVLEWVAS